MHNGNANNNTQGLGEGVHEDFTRQMTMVSEARQNAVPHRHAKKDGVVSLKGPQQRSTEEGPINQDERNLALVNSPTSRQDWNALDLSGQGLRALSTPLFESYTFLTKLYLDNNLLHYLNPSISQLRHLTHLDLSSNGLMLLPPEIGMLVNLRELYLFDNKIRDIPLEIGYLCKLELLGIDGNMGLDEELKDIMVQQGTKALVERLRESIEGRICTFNYLIWTLHHDTDFDSGTTSQPSRMARARQHSCKRNNFGRIL